ncbi:unnamed protein product, partial [Rotaria sp. Silwood1]
MSSSSNNHSKQSSTTFKFTSHSEEFCNSKRAKIMIISIITLLSLLTIIMTVMMFVLRNLHNTTNKTTSSIRGNNVNVYFNECLDARISTTTTSRIYDVGDGEISNDTSCSSHTVVNDRSRNIATYGMDGSCDNGPLFNTCIG